MDARGGCQPKITLNQKKEKKTHLTSTKSKHQMILLVHCLHLYRVGWGRAGRGGVQDPTFLGNATFEVKNFSLY